MDFFTNFTRVKKKQKTTVLIFNVGNNYFSIDYTIIFAPKVLIVEAIKLIGLKFGIYILPF